MSGARTSRIRAHDSAGGRRILGELLDSSTFPAKASLIRLESGSLRPQERIDVEVSTRAEAG